MKRERWNDFAIYDFMSRTIIWMDSHYKNILEHKNMTYENLHDLLFIAFQNEYGQSLNPTQSSLVTSMW